MRYRVILSGLLLVVASAAAVLSFAALRDLARLCGFATSLAWLLPVVVDAGAAAGSLVWLGGATTNTARRFARGLALGLLGLSVAANALGHGLAAFALAPAWWVVVIVSAVAPAVLGAVVHLAVLAGRPAADSETDDRSHAAAPTDADRAAIDAGGSAPTPGPDVGDGGGRAGELIAAGAGRRRLSRELDITEHEARRLLARAREGTGPGDDDQHDQHDQHNTAARSGALTVNGHGGAR